MRKKDWLLTAHLRQNGRMPLTTLSRKTGVPVSTVFDHLKGNLGKLYLRHVALLNFNMLGYTTKVHVLLKAPKESRLHVKEFLEKDWSVNSLYKINNGYDFLAEAIFRNIEELETFLDKLKDDFQIETLDVHYILDDLKRESFLSDPALVDYMMETTQ